MREDSHRKHPWEPNNRRMSMSAGTPNYRYCLPRLEEKDHLRFSRMRLETLGPYGILWIVMVATGCTFVASWDCNTFYGAEVVSSYGGGGGYGIWSLEDSGQLCQLWGVLFASYHLDTPLRMARFFSMTAMLASLAAIAILNHILPWGRIASGLVALGLVYWLADSITFWWRFNVWTSFFMLTYWWMVFFTKCILLPRFSPDCLWKVTQRLMFICCIGSGGIFAILASNVCTCDILTIDDFAFGDNSTDSLSWNPFNTSSWYEGGLESCSGQCVLGPTSTIAIVSPLLWFLGWVGARFVSLETRPYHLLAETSTEEYKPRPRSATGSTMGLSEDNDADDDDVEHEHLQSEVEPLSPSVHRSVLVVTDNSEQSIRPGSLDSTEYKEGNDMLSKCRSETHKEDSYDSSIVKNYCSVGNVMHMGAYVYAGQQAMPRRRLHYVSWTIVSILEMFIVAVLLGSYYENQRAAMAPDTSYNFITDVVCAFDESGMFQTFDNPHQAHKAGYTIAHCGTCGECSNPSDIARYVETRTTVAQQAKKCSLEAILGTDEELESCLEREIGFTRSCTTCWAENMRNTAKQCLWTCLSNILTGVASNNTVEDARDYDWLNQCVFCDEKRSGPAFVACSGVARRRLGIPSEFQRNPMELCPLVEVDYLSNSWPKEFFNR